MGGDTTCVPPDFNCSMLAIWEELWHAMPQSGKVGVTVNSLLQQYKERCRAERKRPRHSSEGPPALLPVSFAQAKDWLLRQQRKQSEALETGAINEAAREVVAELNISLDEQPASTAALLEQPACVASPVVPPPAMSLGPEAVTTKVRAAERAEEQARRQAEQADNPPHPKKTPAPKKKKTTPELEERQQRAEARMLELGVPPLEASNDFLLIKTCHLCLLYIMYCLILLSTYETPLYLHTFNDFFRIRVLMGSVAALFATNFAQPVTRRRMARSIVCWAVPTRYGAHMLTINLYWRPSRRHRKRECRQHGGGQMK